MPHILKEYQKKDKINFDTNNEYTYKKIARKILIFPECIGSTTVGMMFEAVSVNDIASKVKIILIQA